MEKFIQVVSLSQLETIDLSKYDGIYFWIDTCNFKKQFDDEKVNENYLLKYKKILNWKKIVYETALVPKFVENKFFSFLKLFIKVFWENLEISINDWGVYYFLKKNNYLDNIDINIWPNFYYHVKDPYASLIETERFMDISIDKKFYNDYFKKLNFSWLEFFYPLHGLEIKNLSFKKFLFYPYVQYSFTRACPWSLAKAGEKVSKLILDCAWCDRNYYKQQVKQKLKWKDLLVESIYVPNAQYYDISKFYKIEDIEKQLEVFRIIDNHLIIKQ